jgi:hypothetical protein
MNAVVLKKELVPSLTFPQQDVLIDFDSKRNRFFDLMRAMRLGNLFKQKVKLYFMDFMKRFCVETTVWHANTQHVTLKGGAVIPVNRIFKVEI